MIMFNILEGDSAGGEFHAHGGHFSENSFSTLI